MFAWRRKFQIFEYGEIDACCCSPLMHFSAYLTTVFHFHEYISLWLLNMWQFYFKSIQDIFWFDIFWLFNPISLKFQSAVILFIWSTVQQNRFISSIFYVFVTAVVSAALDDQSNNFRVWEKWIPYSRASLNTWQKEWKSFSKVGRNEDDDSTCFWTIYDQLMCDEVISYYDICQRVMNCIFFSRKKKIENTVSKSNQILFFF